MTENIKNLFLGNGFNINIGINTSYKNIYDIMAKKNFLSRIIPNKETMQEHNYDLEKIINSDKKDETIKSVIEYHFFETINLICKNKKITKHQLILKMLNSFDNFFTTNYDPLLYHNLLLQKIQNNDSSNNNELKNEIIQICENKIENSNIEYQIINLKKKDLYKIIEKTLSEHLKKKQYNS